MFGRKSVISLIKNRFIQIWLYPSNPFSLDVKFNEDETQIVASRFLIQAVNVSDTNHEKDMVKILRKVCEESPLNVSVFHPYFVFFDQVRIDYTYVCTCLCLAFML